MERVRLPVTFSPNSVRQKPVDAMTAISEIIADVTSFTSDYWDGVYNIGTRLKLNLGKFQHTGYSMLADASSLTWLSLNARGVQC